MMDHHKLDSLDSQILTGQRTKTTVTVHLDTYFLWLTAPYHGSQKDNIRLQLPWEKQSIWNFLILQNKVLGYDHSLQRLIFHLVDQLQSVLIINRLFSSP